MFSQWHIGTEWMFYFTSDHPSFLVPTYILLQYKIIINASNRLQKKVLSTYTTPTNSYRNGDTVRCLKIVRQTIHFFQHKMRKHNNTKHAPTIRICSTIRTYTHSIACSIANSLLLMPLCILPLLALLQHTMLNKSGTQAIIEIFE